MSTNRAERLANEFWDFACERYAQPGVRPLCLALQDDYGLSVNMLLFCLWQGEQCKQVLTAEFFQHDIAAFERMNREVLEPFRQQRRSADQQQAPWLQKTVQEMELNLERKVQAELVAAVLASKHVQRATMEAPQLLSLGGYLRHQQLNLEEALLQQIKQLVASRE